MSHDPLSPPADLLDTLSKWRRVVLVGHVTPDADCLGSMLAMARCWPSGDDQSAALSLPGTVSSRLRFMIQLAGPRIAEPGDFAAADGYVVTDTAKCARSNISGTVRADWPNGRPVINIDHHLSNTHFGDINWVAPAASASEMVYTVLVGLGRTIDPVAASLLYAGMLTDTVGFSLPRTTADTLRIASELVARGADVGRLGERLSRSLSRAEFDLLRIIYDNTTLIAGGRVAYSTASHEEITGTGCGAEDIDDQVAVPRCLEGVAIAMLFTEGQPGRVRINFRGESGVAVLRLARRFGGGGHAFASGAVMDGSIETVLEAVLPVAVKYAGETVGMDAGPWAAVASAES